MINLQTFFTNNFDDKEISDDELKTFSEDHLRRLAGQNAGGQWSDLLTDTTTAYTDFFGDISDEATHTAVREGLTLRVNETWSDFVARVRRREGRVRDAFGKGTPEYEEFFPRGLDEWNDATLGNIEGLMNRFVESADTHKTTLGQDFLDEFTALKTAFKTARDAQLGKKGAVSSSKSDAKGARDILETQLMKNLLLIAAANVGDVGKAAVFFDQSIIRPAQSAEPKPTPTG